jgi:penicillin-binding protein 1A
MQGHSGTGHRYGHAGRRSVIARVRDAMRRSWLDYPNGDPPDPRTGRRPGATRALATTIICGGAIVGLLCAALLPATGVLVTAQHYKAGVPPLSALAQRSTVYDSVGNVIARLGIQNREDAKLSEVPKILQDAIIAVEDKTFWKNDGIDLNAVARAFLENVTSGEIEQGGSTITQQLVKNRLLTSTRDVDRKVREIVLAIRVDKKYSKEQILEQYLNTVYFGQGSYGVRAAVERMFLKPTYLGPAPTTFEELTVGQAALLAGLIANPEGNNPFLNPEGAAQRRALALRLMVEEKYITQAQADAANQEPLPTIKPEAELRPRTSWAEEVQDRLVHDDAYAVLGKTTAQRRKKLLTGGLSIHTTLDPQLQQHAQNAMNEVLPEKPGFTGALVAIEPKTGFVKAMVAGPGFEQSQYNIATSYPGRQSGSTWKVITLGAALDNGFSPNDTISGSSPCKFPYLGETRNAEGGGGTQTLRRATSGSVNCAFARLQLAVGFDKVIETAKKMGITQDTLQPFLTLTLGAIETTPLEMATVAATIANQGVHTPPLFVSKILGPTDQVVFDAARDVETEQALTPEAAACETELMKGVITGGTGTAARLSGRRDAAGKTGTTDTKADANFLGFTPQLAAFVWHGHALARVEGAGFGGQVPARIWKRFMDAALYLQPNLPLPDPGPYCDRPGARVSEKGRGLPGSAQRTAPPTTTPPTVVVPPPTTPPTTPPVIEVPGPPDPPPGQQ